MTGLAVAPVESQVPVPDAPMTVMPLPLDRTVATPPLPAPTLTSAQAKLLRQMLDGASAHGLTADPAKSSVQPVALGPDDPALIGAVMDHARALHAGRLTKADYLPAWGLRPAAYDPWPGFVAAVTQDRLASWIASLPPPYAGYDALRRGLTTYRQIEASGGWPVVPAGPDIGPGSSGPRVVALRKRLAVEDKDADLGTSDKFDTKLAEHVRRAQKRYGLEPTGTAGQQTLAALNVPAAQRVRQIVANMERWRWLPADLPADRIQVNIAAAVLTMFKGDTPVTSMRAVTGRPGDETPMLQSSIHSIVINPPWNVPQSIAKKELMPKGAAYLKRAGFKIIPLDGGGTRLQQKPGEGNSLGRIKFDFDNPYGVYLHDTSSRATFSRYARMVSHGCVRLERPVDLAELALTGDAKWEGDAVQAAIDKGDTVRARLPQPISVYLLYWTAFASANGQVSFRADPYGWDDTLANKVAASARRAPVVTASVSGGA
ncbi:L,D-transpeptidase family protein [Sphingomonas solaris]|uniref:L,D-transpeptidase family protein n=2 Tax=Alterirhizorhabdus solaris TaxID=2529389 RepID=A0A558RD91_9SPHN|nr:L,D-transpeptidase family protein [Sphingomonas solaris]